jgi:hypothetical protein
MARSKKCFKCMAVKELKEFYKHPKMGDGHLNKCKDCTKNDANSHRKNNLERIREYDRKRGKLANRIKLNTENTRAWRKEDSRRQKAHNAVSRAIKNGRLLKLSCKRCGNEKSLAHHEDYDKPLQIIWLCQPCHKKRHNEINEMIKKGKYNG